MHLNEDYEWIHADVKPENVLVYFSHSQISYYLTDLSVSLQINDFYYNQKIGGTLNWVCFIIIQYIYSSIFLKYNK